MIKIDNIILKPNYTKKNIFEKVAEKLQISPKSILNVDILKYSIDARKKPNIKIILCVSAILKDDLEETFLDLKYELDTSKLEYPKKNSEKRPVVVGFGPAGMFCSLCLARMGLKPMVIEQGKCVEERSKDVENFWQSGILDKFSNVQFGEGGAGTFSDGKLNTNINNAYCKKVINEFYYFGAPKEILTSAKPHIGSDKLKNVVKNIRNEIISLGGEILFSHKFCNIVTEKNSIKSVLIKELKTNLEKNIETNALFLALGHSARDTFQFLYDFGFEIHTKPFAMGVRIEQNQQDINESQYGKGYDKSLPPADYKLVAHLKNGRSVFTFCMCPGGQVVASSSGEGEIVTNGMSNFERNGQNANSAVLVNVLPEDYGSSHPLSGIYFQQKYEKLCFELAGKKYSAPAQTVASFLGKQNNNIENSNNKTEFVSSYRPSITKVQLKDCLPDFVTESLKQGLVEFNKKLHNFAKDENLLIGIESRSSCPLTIVRGDNFQTKFSGIFPIGEGAGYAGGIMSSAIDGVKASEFFYSILK
ncbi:MAG: hypothetical protein EOM55_01015 [Clostridia bacterium]|nr:hypothetical protein [Clostridia bacterium]